MCFSELSVKHIHNKILNSIYANQGDVKPLIESAYHLNLVKNMPHVYQVLLNDELSGIHK